MKNYIQAGKVITVTAPMAGIASGDALVVDNIFGVAAADAAAGENVEIGTLGVYELPKLSSAAFDQGDGVAWDSNTGKVVAPATGMFPIGIVIEAADNGTATVKVRLDGVATAAA
ncbi:MAG TPA: DUF2190 family protein [Devosia sp.]|nr:DUF2190 family protein [Devosia sp.]